MKILIDFHVILNILKRTPRKHSDYIYANLIIFANEIVEQDFSLIVRGELYASKEVVDVLETILSDNAFKMYAPQIDSELTGICGYILRSDV